MTDKKFDEGWSEAAIAWNVCASIHREFARGRDPDFRARQDKFIQQCLAAQGNMAIEKKPRKDNSENLSIGQRKKRWR